MKRLSMIMVCLFAMMAASTGLKAQEISILLRPGWNWIGYPYPETVDLENAFGDFEPMTDDVIESFWGYSEYVAGYGWFGGIDELKPGWGYMYYSNRTEPVTIVFSPSSPPVEPITVTTTEPTEITANSAVSGGSITSNDGNYIYVIQKGICWATHPNPMVMNDSFTESGSGAESFTAEMTDLSPNTDYYVRAYAVTLDGTFYGDELNFITLDDGGSNVPEGAINGLFSINANGDQVYFSQGNLQYRASTNTWRFAENQQDIIGYANSNISSTYDGWIDLFGWGTSGYDDKYPWMTSMNETDYGDNQNNIAYTEYDWGQHNPISNGGNQAGLWRTLSSAELGYMIYQRDNWQNLYAMGLVNGWHGLIILPDDFVLPENITFTPDYKLFTDDVNNFSLEEWSQMESLGAVFLPVAGIREGTQVREVDASGLYWSTDILSPDDGAREMWFGAAYIYYNPGIGGTIGRHCGISVRLVHDANQAFTSYSIEATTNPSNGGTITGTGFYAEGATCTLTAVSNNGYTFANWTENSIQVSEDANYTFTVMNNRTLVANFALIQGEGSGTAEDPYNVAAGISLQSEEPVAWVHGYIVGAVKSGLSSVSGNSDINWSAPFDLTTNVVIADYDDCREISQCIIVKLPAGKPLRTQVNLMDNPNNLGGHLAVIGKLRTCFDQAGLCDSNGTEYDFVLEGVGTPPTPGTEIFSETFALGQGDFTIYDAFLPSGLSYVWQHAPSYSCMKANAYFSGQNHEAESWLVSPAINLAGVSAATLRFEQAINYASPVGALYMLISTDYNGDVTTSNWNILSLDQWPAGNNWTFITSSADLTPYVGQNVTIAFKYTSTNSSSATWEVKNFVVE